MEFLVKKILVPERKSFKITEQILYPQTYKVHSHNNYELNFIKHGWGKRYVGDNISNFQTGDLVLLGPNMPHCWEVKGTLKECQPKCIVIHFKENFLGSEFINTPELQLVLNLLRRSSQGLYFKGKQIAEIRELMEIMLNLDGLNSLIYLLKIFSLLLEFDESLNLSTPGYIEQANQSDFQKINKIYEYIFINFQKDITLKEVADLVNLTSGSLCRYFKDKTGKTLFNFLKEVRIGYACKLLNATDKTITEICFECGYNTLAHFNTQFKELMQITPTEYRKNSIKVLS